MAASWTVEMLFTLFFCVIGRCWKAVKDQPLVGVQISNASEAEASALRAAGRFFRFGSRFHTISIPDRSRSARVSISSSEDVSTREYPETETAKFTFLLFRFNIKLLCST